MKLNKLLSQDHNYPLNVYKKKIEEYQGEKSLINLTIGDPCEKSYNKAYEALKKEAETRKESSYPITTGSIEYRQAVLNWAKRNYQFKGDIDSIISTNGSKEAIFHLALLFDWSNNNKEIFFSSISYPVYKMSAKILSIPYRELPVSEKSNFFPDLDKISKKLWEKCQVFWINSPHNPTSCIAKKAYLEKLIALAKKYNFLICSDECYNDIYFGSPPHSFLEFPNSKYWFVFRSLSKRNNMTGFRVGALITQNKDLLRKYSSLRLSMGVGTPDFIQKAAIKAWDNDTFAEYNRKQYKKKRILLKNCLEEKGFQTWADGGFYLWVKHSKLSAKKIWNLFLSQGLLLTLGEAFGKDGKDYLRMIYCITTQQCSEIIKRIKNLKI